MPGATKRPYYKGSIFFPLFLIEKYFEKNFKFHGPLDIPQYLIRKMPEFYSEILLN